MTWETSLFNAVAGWGWVQTVIGGFITLVVSRLYFQKASKELTGEASELRRLTILMLRAMEENGEVKFSRNESGVPIGMVFTRIFKSNVAVGDSFSTKVSRADGRKDE